ncbi:MAG TPA: hypothetical protein VFR10_00175 [bacterium]|nr:hypothetical protein [bacterium]
MDLAVTGIQEPSGVMRSGPHLYLVGDDDPGSYFEFDLTPEELAESSETRRIPLDPKRLKRYIIAADECANDLEGLDVLADGRIAVFSEERRALFDQEGIIAFYGRVLQEFGTRGVEGVAVQRLPNDSSRVAVLWEGGYPDEDEMPVPLRMHCSGISVPPFILIHDLAAGESRKRVLESDAERIVILDVPATPGAEPAAQRFRAPDLVWHSWKEGGITVQGFIVLLSSGSAATALPGSPEECPKSSKGAPLRFCYKWLQRFRLDGSRAGEPYELEQVFPPDLRTANWEGMGWYEEGKRLVLTYERSFEDGSPDLQEAFVMPLPQGW